jgi:hypothetical protein
MNSKPTQRWNSLSPKQRKWAKWIAGLLLFYTVTGFFILPPIIRAVAAKQIAKQLDREVSIEKVKLNPFAFSVTIRGLLVKDKDGEPFISWDEVYVNLELVSLIGHPWVFKEVRTTRPFLRAQMNKDYSFNFSDLIAKFSTNAATSPATPAKPLALRIDRLHIAGAAASLTDLTPHTPFKRIIGPLDVTLENFRTDPENKNPYSFSGTTDAGEKFAWSGFFYLDPLRSHGDISLENVSLNKYAPLYQDLVRFQIRDGIVDIHSTYEFVMNATNRVASVTNTSFALHSFKLVDPGSETTLAELPEFSVTGASLDVFSRTATVESIAASGARLALQRDKNDAINVVEISRPSANATNAPGAILLLLRAVTNGVALLLNSTNAWAASVRDVDVHDCALSLQDAANARPVRLDLDQISLRAKNISNLAGTNLSAALSLRWNTNGAVKTEIEASLSPPSADIHLALDNLELRPLDPYLEPKVNVFIIGSKLGMDGHVRLRTTTNAELPEVTFTGDAWLNDFSTLDGVMAEELLKWSSVRISGIDANLSPPTLGIREISVRDAYARLIIETNHTINLLEALHVSDTNAPATAAAATETHGKKKPATTAAAAPPAIRPADSLPFKKLTVGSVVISNAQARFSDRSLTPNVNLTIEQINGTVSGLSLEELQHADVRLDAKVDNVGPVNITGTINPFAGNQTNEIKILVKNVDLTPASPYAGKFAGYRIARGKLDMALAYHLHGRTLKSENVITINQFTFGEKVNSPDATRLPVRLAVAILKDRDGKIVLDVPIEGSLDDPQFKLHKVILHTLGNMFTKLVTSPFAVLGSLFGGKGEEIRYQDFDPGSADLQTAGREKLEALIKGLYERPGLQLQIEGSIDPITDRGGLQKTILEKQLRTRKWLSLRKSDRSAITPDQITLAPEERSALVKKLYGDALSNGQITASATNSNHGTPMPSLYLPAEMERGATALMSNDSPPVGGRPEMPASAGLIPSDPFELALRNSTAVTDNDFQELAASRAKSVRAYLLQSGKVEADRLFLTDAAAGVKTNGSRVYLQLQ